MWLVSHMFLFSSFFIFLFYFIFTSYTLITCVSLGDGTKSPLSGLPATQALCHSWLSLSSLVSRNCILRPSATFQRLPIPSPFMLVSACHPTNRDLPQIHRVRNISCPSPDPQRRRRDSLSLPAASLSCEPSLCRIFDVQFATATHQARPDQRQQGLNEPHPHPPNFLSFA